MSDIKARDLQFRRAETGSTEARLAREFVKAHHYSKTCPPGHFYFLAHHNDVVVGAAVYRKPSLPNTRRAYEADIELSRLVLIDDCGKNSESRFIGFQLKWLKKNAWPSKVVSFADPVYGHSGVIYKAANFDYLGREKGHGTRRIYVNDEELHSKTAYDRYGCSGAKLKDLLPGMKVEIKVMPPKHVYVYSLEKRRGLPC
jgi:hypothetical protein